MIFHLGRKWDLIEKRAREEGGGGGGGEAVLGCYFKKNGLPGKFSSNAALKKKGRINRDYGIF